MSAAVLSEAHTFRRALREVDVTALAVESCVSLVEVLASVEKTAAALRARAAARVAVMGSRKIHSETDAAEWMARAMGSSTGAAKSLLETAAALEGCPVTRSAVAEGTLSMEQAREITRCESDCPGTEAELASFAREHSLRGLKEEVRRRRLAAIDPSELHARQQQARTFRHWRDELGMVCVSGKLTPAVGVALLHRLEAEADRVFRGAVAKDRRELPHGYFAGVAFERILRGEAKGGRGRTDLVVVCDLNAWRRGHGHPGEPVHIVGGGPIPVELARQLAEDAFVKGVLHDGVNIHHVWHAGRYKKAELRTALELGAAPGFDGVACVELGCDRRYGLEWDHVDPVANGGPTTFENLDPYCRPEHRDKTEADRAAGLLAGRSEGRGPP